MTPEQKDALITLLDKLPAADLDAVSSFAEFLSSRSGQLPLVARREPPAPPAPVEIPDPDNIPRPNEERVVAAVKRLSKTYFMLDKKQMLSATSELVTQHVLQGRDAVEVIDELESLFREQYRQLKKGGQS
jgi:hypothetical protein